MTSNPAGTATWVDLATPDVAAAKAFYGGLFGWTAQDSTEPEAGGYVMFYRDGKNVAGAGPIQGPGQPSAWTSYFGTDNADETAALVEKAGGHVLMAPMDVMAYGRMAVFTDPAGAAFATWQPGTHHGAELFNQPGSLTWNELTTRDVQGAKTFYGEVFGWQADDAPMGPITYTTWKLGDRQVGGMMPMVGDEWPEDMPPHWMVYFAVTDTDATAAKADQLGGGISVPPHDLPVGRFSVLSDPGGAYFSVIALNQAA